MRAGAHFRGSVALAGRSAVFADAERAAAGCGAKALPPILPSLRDEAWFSL